MREKSGIRWQGGQRTAWFSKWYC